MSAASSPLFQSGTNELLAAVCDSYLHGTLDPSDAQTVEAYLEVNPVECGVVLARYHELSAARRGRGLPELLPPAWVGQQLQRQASVSGWGPLRRPAVLLSLGTLLALAGFSGVRWARHEPLVPTPLRRTINSAAQTLGQPAVYSAAELIEAAEPATPEPAPPVPAARPVAVRPAPAVRQSQSQDQGEPEDSRDARLVTVRPDSVTTAQLPNALDSLPRSRPSQGPSPAGALVAASERSGGASPAPSRVVRGHVFDERGRPLAGATVLVRGTSMAAVTDATGSYALDAPAGAVLLVGYAGYFDEQLLASQPSGLDATLEPQVPGKAPRRARRPL